MASLGVRRRIRTSRIAETMLACGAPLFPVLMTQRNGPSSGVPPGPGVASAVGGTLPPFRPDHRRTQRVDGYESAFGSARLQRSAAVGCPLPPWPLLDYDDSARASFARVPWVSIRPHSGTYCAKRPFSRANRIFVRIGHRRHPGVGPPGCSRCAPRLPYGSRMRGAHGRSAPPAGRPAANSFWAAGCKSAGTCWCAPAPAREIPGSIREDYGSSDSARRATRFTRTRGFQPSRPLNR